MSTDESTRESSEEDKMNDRNDLHDRPAEDASIRGVARDRTAPSPGRRRRRGAEAVLAAAAAVGIAVTVFFVTRSGAGSRSSDGAGGAAAAPASAGEPSSASRRRPGEVALAAGVTAKNKIEVVPVRRTTLAGDINVIGNVSFSADHVAIVGPLVSGRIARLAAGIGARVERGQVVAEVESADVGDARAALIAARARLSAADANLRRERELADKQISSVREREQAEAQSATERAGMRAAEQRLRAIGLSTADINAVEQRDDGGRVPIRAPLSGTVIERLVTLGEAVERATDAFKIADLSKVWVLLDLYEKDLARVRIGQAVELRTDTRPGEVFHGRVGYLSPVIDQATRAAKVRVEIDNSSGKLNIGQLVIAKLIGSAAAATGAGPGPRTATGAGPDANPAPVPVLVIPADALQRIDGKPTVFVKTEHGFERRGIEVGIAGQDLVEVRAGLAENEQVAGKGAFLLKSELLR
jgi:membrane fusion protein, heavy metal efflux system